MTGSIDTNRSVAYGLVLSVAFHAAAVVGLINQGVFSGGRPAETLLLIPPEEVPPPDQPKPEPPKPPDPDQLQLGIRESTAKTKTWIGFEDPTEHSGLKSDTEQAQVAENPGGAPPAPMAEESQAQSSPEESSQPPSERPTPPAPIPQPPPAPAPEPKPETPPAAHAPEPAPATEPAPQQPKPAEPSEPVPSEAEAPELPEADSPEALPPDPQEPAVEEKVTPSQPTPAAITQPVVSPPPAAPPTPKEAAKETTAATPPKAAKEFKSRSDYMGIADDRIAVATALKEAIQVIPGRPAAAKGMRIKTVPPRPSVTTQLTASPRNAVMWVIFGPDGKVKDTDFFAGQTTGSEAWDGALRSAVFAWRASGEEIDKLPKNDARAGVSVMFKISMR